MDQGRDGESSSLDAFPYLPARGQVFIADRDRDLKILWRMGPGDLLECSQYMTLLREIVDHAGYLKAAILGQLNHRLREFPGAVDQ